MIFPGVLYILFHLLLPTNFSIIIEVKKPRLREITQLAQVHTDMKDLKQISVNPKPVFFPLQPIKHRVKSNMSQLFTTGPFYIILQIKYK